MTTSTARAISIVVLLLLAQTGPARAQVTNLDIYWVDVEGGARSVPSVRRFESPVHCLFTLPARSG
jgi:hypothetical protein